MIRKLLLALTLGWLAAIPSAHGGDQSGLYIYDCYASFDGSCNEKGGNQTPPFDTCAGWAGWVIPQLDPKGGPYTFSEGPFSGGGLLCSVLNSGGGQVRISVAHGFCQNPDYTISGAVGSQICTAASTVPEKARQQGPSCPHCGNPVNPAPSVGNKYESALDYLGSGQYPLRLERFYNSALSTIYPGNRMQAFAMANWRHTYDRKIALLVRGSTSFARVDRPDGNSLYFSLTGSSWIPGDSDIIERLEQAVESGQTIFKLTNRDDEVERYDQTTGRLLSITNRAGLAHTVAYDSSNRVQSVTDPFGRSLQFSYGAANCSGNLCVASVQDPAGNVIQYVYQSPFEGRYFTQLKTVTFPGTATPITYNYASDAPDLLTSLVDENGNTTASWFYTSPTNPRC